MRLIIRWVISIVALAAAAYFVPGIQVSPNAILVYAVMAVILGLVNAIIRPILTVLSCGFVIVTLGLFLLVVNALCLWIASGIAENWFNVGFHIDSFWSALLGSIIVSIVSFILSIFLVDKREEAR